MGYEKVPIEFYPIQHQQNVLEPASPLDYDNLAKNIQHVMLLNQNETASNYDSGAEEIEATPSASSCEGIHINNCHSRQELESDNDSNVENILNGTKFTVTMYYGSSQNEHYIGPDSLTAMAKQIFESVGPSGRNKDYLFNLAKAMRQINDAALDDHLAELEEAVRDLEIQFNLKSPPVPMEL
jgi:hypothetical protein